MIVKGVIEREEKYSERKFGDEYRRTRPEFAAGLAAVGWNRLRSFLRGPRSHGIGVLLRDRDGDVM